MTHLGDRVAALADGELSHEERDRALAHVANCSACRAELDLQRQVRALLASAFTPPPGPDTLDALLSLAAPGGPLPPRSRTMPHGPVVPELPPPRRLGGRWAHPRRDGHRPTRADSRRPGERAVRRVRVATAGALSVAGLVLGTAFVAGGTGAQTPVAPPVGQLSVEHGRTAVAVTVGDPGLGLMSGLSGSGLNLGRYEPSTTRR